MSVTTDIDVVAPPGRMPPALPQFSHINRYWDQSLGSFVAKLLPGEYYVTERAEVICTVLGSCVSACVRDRVRGLGGMNPFMLPIDQSQGTGAWSEGVSAATRYGNIAMEMLINDLLKLGARRQHLEVKLVGGGKVLAAATDVGANNIDFVRKYVLTEGFEVSGEDLGGRTSKRRRSRVVSNFSSVYFPYGKRGESWRAMPSAMKGSASWWSTIRPSSAG